MGPFFEQQQKLTGDGRLDVLYTKKSERVNTLFRGNFRVVYVDREHLIRSDSHDEETGPGPTSLMILKNLKARKDRDLRYSDFFSGPRSQASICRFLPSFSRS